MSTALLKSVNFKLKHSSIKILSKVKSKIEIPFSMQCLRPNIIKFHIFFNFLEEIINFQKIIIKII